jgi:UDP-sugar transporter A1/2/3
MRSDTELTYINKTLEFLEKTGTKQLVISSQPPRHDWKVLVLMLVIAIGLKSWQPLAIAHAKQDDGSYSFNTTTMVVMVEFVKLVFCAGVLSLQLYEADPLARQQMLALDFKTSLHFLVPSLLYAASNTLVYLAMSYINPALFHVLGNIRIIVAGVLYRLIMKKKQSDLQWAALFLLMIGAALATPDLGELSLSKGENSTLLGLLFVVLMCLCSTSSSIYTEMFFKKTKDLSIFYQNCVLYFYGILVNLIILAISSPSSFSTGLFHGWDGAALQVLVCQSAMGVSLSFIFKFLDNIVYVFSLTASMIFTICLSIMLFDFSLSSAFVFAVCIVCTAIYLYYRSKILEKYNLDPNQVEF